VLKYGTELWPVRDPILPPGAHFFTEELNVTRASLGFYDYVARQFDPALGRFLQADTIIPDPANPQSLNRYSYTLGNPLRYTDPTGHKECDRLCKGEKTDDRFIGSEYAGEWDPLFTAAQQYALLSPSGIGLYAQVDASYNLGADISTSLSGAIIFNWHSGEISLVPSLGGGLGLSEPGSHAGIGGGIIIPIGYSTNQSLVGGSEDSSVSLGLGASGSKDLSLDLGVSQEAEINFQTNETRPFFDDGTGIQPYSLTFGVSLSENQSYSPVKLPDISIYHGVSQTPVIFTVQLYPWNWD